MDHYLCPYTRINSKWIRNLNVRLDTIKLLEGNIGSKLLDNALGNDFLDMTPKAQTTKEITKGLHQTEKLLHSKDPINRVGRQPMEQRT